MSNKIVNPFEFSFGRRMNEYAVVFDLSATELIGTADLRHEAVKQDMYMLMHSEFGGQQILRLTLWDSGQLESDVFGMGVADPIDSGLEGSYPCVDALPRWAKERLAVLMVVDPKIKPTRSIPDVGMRINDRVFWVFVPDGYERVSAEGE